MKAFIFLICSFVTTTVLAKECVYRISPKEINITWIAYKTPKKAPVSGRFADIGASAETLEGNNLSNLLKKINLNIDTASIRTKNSGRDANIVRHFFQKFTGGLEIKTNVVNATKEKIEVSISMNKVTKNQNLTYKIEKSMIKATGSFDMLDYSLDGALASINKACFELHEGKTWSDVGLEVIIPLEESCK